MEEISKNIDQEKDVEKFREWLEDQKIFPKNLSSVLLYRFLKVCDFNVEKAGELLQYNLELRAKYPHIFTNRDINSKEIRQAINTFQMCALPKYTKENNRITLSRLNDDDPAKFDVVDVTRWFFVLADTGFVRMPPNGLPEKEIGVMDFKGFTWRHLLKIAQNLSTVRVGLKYLQEAVPYKIAANHYINCSPILTRIIALIRPFISREHFKIMHFHTSGFESLHEYIPQEVLPNEYGGTAGPADEIFKEYFKNVEDNFEYVSNDDNWKLKLDKSLEALKSRESISGSSSSGSEKNLYDGMKILL